MAIGDIPLTLVGNLTADPELRFTPSGQAVANFTVASTARFLDRPNRFVAHVLLGQETVTCHVKNTGRCRELLVPGATVYLERGTNPNRRTDK